jgi:hypothetical protein
VEKLVYLLWRPADTDRTAWSRELRGPLVERLRRAGTRGIQVNVADADVDGALVRLTTFDEPVEAVVGLWVDTVTGLDAVDAALAGAAPRRAGYLVTESVPLPHDGPDDGGRTDGFANLALLRRPDHLDVEAWRDRWQGHHTAVALEIQATFGYTQNVVVRPVTDDAPAVDGIVEELFPTAALTDLHVFFATDGDDDELGRRLAAMTDSVAAFSGTDASLDVIPTSRFVVDPAFR